MGLATVLLPIGVMLIWCLADRTGLGITDDRSITTIEFSITDRKRVPDWNAVGLARVTGR